MRLTLIFIYLSFMVSARKRNIDKKTEEETDEVVEFVDTVLDLRGTVRKDFALEAAFLDHARNMICSPMSVLMPLGKLVIGAEGAAERELLNAIGITSRKQIKALFAQLITNMEYLPGVTLDVASRIYIAADTGINKKFLKRSKLIFKSTCKKMNTKNPDGTARDINEWVASKTKNKIRNLVNPSDITKDTSLILVNAIYFAGKWKDKFDRVHTEEFHAPTGVRRIPMISRQGQYNYWMCDTLNAQVIEIPYEGEQSAMIIVLPFSKSGLPVLLRALKLAPELLNQALEKMKTANVILSMPKFKIESELDLTKLYQKIGLTNIFDSTHSKLTGIVKKRRVYVSKAVHKAVIEVNEKGTEAAAATGIQVFPLTAAVAIEFKASHPFLFYIVANKQQMFAGQFMDGVIKISKFTAAKLETVKFDADHPFIFFISAFCEQLFTGVYNGS